MQTLRDLLNRIQWDSDFGTGFFELGVYDRKEDCLIRIQLDNIHFDEGNSFSFSTMDLSGTKLRIPFHRVKEVRKDGCLIWKRPD